MASEMMILDGMVRKSKPIGIPRALRLAKVVETSSAAKATTAVTNTP
jgi:hypothetical protein